MAAYRINCAQLEPCPIAAGRFHIVLVGTGAALRDRNWTPAAIDNAMKNGDHFYIQSRTTNETADVHCLLCP